MPAREQLEQVRRCDGCDAALPAAATHCTACGIHLADGRPLITSIESSRAQRYEQARRFLWLASWPLMFGIAPVVSEAHVPRRPLATWCIAALTAAASLWFLALLLGESPSMRAGKQLMLWCGSEVPDAETLATWYLDTSFGDRAAYLEKTWGRDGLDPVAAHRALPRSQQATGRFAVYQLLTYMFLHGGVGHLAGNLILLLFLGSRVNGLLGDPATVASFVLCGVGAALAESAAGAWGPRTPMLGASGAISGLAGMYLVFFPAQRLYLAGWVRPWFVGVPFLYLRLFRTRGVWFVLVCFVLLDVVSLAARGPSDVAHWAHLGGFTTGLAIASALLVLRMANAHGDLISVIFGRRAWGVLGRPCERRQFAGVGWGVLRSGRPGR